MIILRVKMHTFYKPDAHITCKECIHSVNWMLIVHVKMRTFYKPDAHIMSAGLSSTPLYPPASLRHPLNPRPLTRGGAGQRAPWPAGLTGKNRSTMRWVHQTNANYMRSSHKLFDNLRMMEVVFHKVCRLKLYQRDPN